MKTPLYKNILQNIHIKNDTKDMDMALEDISSLLDGVKKTLKVKKRLQRARNKPSSKLWYDQSCKELRYKATILALFIKEKPKG